MGEQRTAIVVGGGIGGLATAAALSDRGWRVEVMERAPGFREVGAGLSVWSNGVRALDALGIGEQVRAQAMTETQAGIRDSSGRWLSRTDTEEVDRRYGPLVMLHRAHLLAVLHEAVSGIALRTGVTVTGVRAAGRQVEVVHEAGADRADLVVGADGIRSAVRRSLWPQAPEPRYVGYTAWRLLVDPGARLDAGGESWGRGERMGLVPLPGGRIYMFGVANTPAGERSPDGELAELRRRFAGWHDPIPALLDRADENAVLRTDLYELPPLKSFVSGRVALLGDAAHAMTPNLGQGACQALEDAVTLAAVLDRHPTVEAALAAYDRERRPRSQMIARRSHRVGAVAQWSSRPAVALRNRVMSLTPPSSMLRSLGPVLDWRPPA
ncbi:FAD-dependent monooxygenase [Actinomadura latina]|uniref:NAD(P)-binding protein n=1 Tax=Actinomadura latina TaxID=163603 RepID=A0A846YUJ3_9ACTN|nr:FAD-dependent monooxygenase [Actinomadura latina]NKZ02365.1 NAD(P)-binding protein [Actinomadura latina]